MSEQVEEVETCVRGVRYAVRLEAKIPAGINVLSNDGTKVFNRYLEPKFATYMLGDVLWEIYAELRKNKIIQ
jgi:hypothetical protein